jgi:hypothetical protein
MQDSPSGVFLKTALMGSVDSGNEKDSSASHRLLIEGGVHPANILCLRLKKREIRDKPSTARIGYRRAM